jgi:hypothetical protein
LAISIRVQGHGFKPGAIDHPSEGESGDVFVDAAGNLWFCKGPGTWVKLA